MRTWKKKMIFNYFPFITFLVCIVGELVLAEISPISSNLRGVLIFDIWPILLLAWIIYWAIAWPACTKHTYFLFVLLVFFTLFLVAASTICIKLFNLPTDAKDFISHNIGKAIIGLFVLLALYQLWAKRHWKENRE